MLVGYDTGEKRLLLAGATRPPLRTTFPPLPPYYPPYPPLLPLRPPATTFSSARPEQPRQGAASRFILNFIPSCRCSIPCPEEQFRERCPLILSALRVRSSHFDLSVGRNLLIAALIARILLRATYRNSAFSQRRKLQGLPIRYREFK